MTRLNVLALIPARGGSKGIPRKNLQPLAGKPLVLHTVEQALQASLVTQTVVSTDDEAIAAVCQAAGARIVRRPPEISGDTASSESALVHALEALSSEGVELPDLVLFLQCTSPLRYSSDIDNAIRTLQEQKADSLLSVSPSHQFLWEETEEEVRSINYDFRNRPRRQDMKPQYAENGSIYLFRPKGLLETGNRLSGKVVLYKMDDQSSIDIDSPLDLLLAEAILQERERR